MLYVIVTCRSLFWCLCSIGCFMVLISAITTPKWLLGYERTRIIGNRTFHYQNSIGIYNKCDYNVVGAVKRLEEQCIIHATQFSRITPTAWKACIVFLGVGISLVGIAALLAIISFCKQIVRNKSLVNLAGILQAMAGIFLVLAVVLYPVGWKDNPRFFELCRDASKHTDPTAPTSVFKIEECGMGIAFYLAIAGMLGAFFCSLCAIIADRSVFNDKVQDEILEGKHLICLP